MVAPQGPRSPISALDPVIARVMRESFDGYRREKEALQAQMTAFSSQVAALTFTNTVLLSQMETILARLDNLTAVSRGTII